MGSSDNLVLVGRTSAWTKGGAAVCACQATLPNSCVMREPATIPDGATQQPAMREPQAVPSASGLASPNLLCQTSLCEWPELNKASEI
jgi:hypothetical protein